jgi:hypothetical protein
LGQLCTFGADSFIIYPLLIINNVQMENQQDELGLVTIDDPDPNSEAKIVVQTNEVGRAEYLEGLEFSYHMMSLYSMRGLRLLGRHLDSSGQLSFAELVSQFADFCRRAPATAYFDYIRHTISGFRHYQFASSGGVLHITLHSGREEFDLLLAQFVRTLPAWSDPQSRLLFELDILNRPHIYLNTPILDKRDRLELIRVTSVTPDGYVVEFPANHLLLAASVLNLTLGAEQSSARVKYRTTQFPYMPAKSLESHYEYCQDKLHKVASVLPVWSLVETSVAESHVVAC